MIRQINCQTYALRFTVNDTANKRNLSESTCLQYIFKYKIIKVEVACLTLTEHPTLSKRTDRVQFIVQI